MIKKLIEHLQVISRKKLAAKISEMYKVGLRRRLNYEQAIIDQRFEKSFFKNFRDICHLGKFAYTICRF